VTRVALTGTPGTGKTTVSETVGERTGLDVIHLNDAIREEGLFTDRDAERDSLVTDLDAVAEWLGEWDGVLESHLAHRFDADVAVVLRCHPEELERRLRDRGESEAKARENAESSETPRALARKARENAESSETPRALARKARENAESEALDVVLAEAVERFGEGAVYEIDTTGRDPGDVADDVVAAVEGETEPRVGVVDFIDYL
jgi:adenylate kinase